MPSPPRAPRRSLLGRRPRETLITDLPDELLQKIIQHVLQMRKHGEVSRRVRPRFRTHGRSIAQVSRRFNMILRRAITAVEFAPEASRAFIEAMIIFGKDSLLALHLPAELSQSLNRTSPRDPSWASHLCLLLAATRPPLRSLSLASLAGAPFEHVVAMLRALPFLKSIELPHPRPVDIAAIARTCPGLERLSIGSGTHEKDVDEMRRQFVNLICSPVGTSLRNLNMPWSCATQDAFKQIGKNCVHLEKFGAEFGALHWIKHRAFKAKVPLEVDLCAYAKEQRVLFHAMLRAVAKSGRLQSFAVRTLDGIPTSDLELIFMSLKRLEDLDLFIGSSNRPLEISSKIFDKMTTAFAPTLRKVSIGGVGFNTDQVSVLSRKCSNLHSLSIWMVGDQRPSMDVFESLGKKIKHMSILCEWTEPMCEAVGKHNTNLESIFLVTKKLPISSIASLVAGVGVTLKEFRLFIHRSRDPPVNSTAVMTETSGIVMNAARLVAKDCAANLEVLNISATAGNGLMVDCATIATELRRTAPHLWQICDDNVVD